MKKITLLMFMCFCSMAYSQIEIDTTWQYQINKAFKGVDKSRIPTGVLLDYAMEFVNVPAYNGTLTDSTAIDVDIFGDIYKTLYSGLTVADSTYFPQFRNVARMWAAKRIEANTTEQNTIVLGGLLYEYAKISPNAVRDGKINIVSNTTGLADSFINGVWQNPYETLKTIAFAPPVRSYDQKSFKVVLSKDMLLSNMAQDIRKIELDFEDGTGFHELEYGIPVNVTYTEARTFKWVFKVTLGNNIPLYSFSHFHIKDGDTNNPVTISNISGAKLRIDYAPGHNGQIIKPFIVAEGFDAGSILEPESDGGDTTYRHFKTSIQFSGLLDDLLDDDATQQYDVIYIDWKNGTDDLKNNSIVLENVIQWVNSHKVGNEDIVLMGQSMGGVISRYTLARMEKSIPAVPHHVRLFISHDAPMQGSNTPLSAQFLSRHMSNEYAQTNIAQWAETIIIPMFLTMGQMMADAINRFGTNFSVGDYASPMDALSIQDTPAAVEMNYEWVTFGENSTTALHDLWQEDLEDMGYPQLSRNIAISNGDECAKDHGFEAGDMLVTMHKSGSKAFWRQLMWSIAAPFIGIALDNVELIILGAIPGSSEYEFDFDVKSTPALTNPDRSVYYGRISYTKKILFILPITIHLTQRSKNAAPNSLPHETHSGGSFDLSDVTDELPDMFPDVDLINTVYGFIPTVSSLDIKRNSGTVIPEDYQKIYAGGHTPEPELTSGFDSFVVETHSFPPFNSEHITFQFRTGNWLAQELNNTSQFQIPAPDCSLLCKANAITGPELVCSSGSFTTYPGLSTYYWYLSPSGAGSINSGQGSPNTFISFNGSVNGYVYVNVFMTVNGCDSATLVKKIWVGKPATPNGISGQAHALTGAMVGYMTNATAAEYYQWTLPGGYQMVPAWNLSALYWQMLANDCSGSALQAYSGTGGITGYVSATPCNICGCGDPAYLQVYANDSGGLGITPTPINPGSDVYSVSPNPSGQLLNIQLRDPNVLPGTTLITGKLYDFYGNVVKNVTLANNSASVDVSGLPTGVYTLQININGSIEPHQVLVVR